MLLQDGQFHGPGSQFGNEVFPHPQLHKQPSIQFSEFARQQHIQQPTTITDPTMGRTNIPMPLPPGSTYSIDGTSVTLTPLSPPQLQPGQEGMVTGLEVPYAHHAHPQILELSMAPRACQCLQTLSWAPERGICNFIHRTARYRNPFHKLSLGQAGCFRRPNRSTSSLGGRI